MSKLGLDINEIKEARSYALKIAKDTQEFIDKHTTVTVERTVCRLLGIDGVNEFGVPYPNILVDHIVKNGELGIGISNYLASTLKATNLGLDEISKLVEDNKLDLTKYPLLNEKEVVEILSPFIEESLYKIKENKFKREDYFDKFGQHDGPMLYVIVATGNIYEDVVQARAAAKAGADIVAVIRTTGQSLLYYVPYGPTTEGFV